MQIENRRKAPTSSYVGFISRSTKSFEISCRLFALSGNPGELEHQKNVFEDNFYYKNRKWYFTSL